MLRILLQIYFDGIRRNLNKTATIVILCSLFLCVVCLSFLFLCFDEERQHFAKAFDWFTIVPSLAVAIMIPDFILKFFVWKSETFAMDDFVKTRPVDFRSWHRFQLLINAFDMANWGFPAVMVVFSIFTMNIWQVLLSALLYLCVSLMNGEAVKIIRMEQDVWTPVYIIGIFWIPAVSVYCTNPFAFSPAVHVLGLAMVCLLMTFGLYKYGLRLRPYADYRSTARSTSQSDASLGTLVFYGFVRSKRIAGWLFFPLIVLLQLLFLRADADDSTNQLIAEVYVILLLLMASIGIGTNVFGMIANFIDGLWTRPCQIKRLFFRVYYFCAAMNILYAVLAASIIYAKSLLPLYFVFAVLIFNVGTTNLLLYINSFTSNRIPLFTQSFFTNSETKDASKKILYAYICALPFVFVLAVCWLFSIFTASVVLGTVGLVGILIHPIVINFYANKYLVNRYKHFERYRN